MATTIRASASTTIDRDVEDVFAYLTEFTTMDEWMVGVSDTTLVSGEGGRVGDVYEFDYTYSGRTEPMRVEVTAIEPGARIEMVAREGPFPFRGELTLDEVGEETRVTNAIEPGADGRFTAILFTLLRPVMRWLMARQVRAELDDLKANLEAREPAATSATRVDEDVAPE